MSEINRLQERSIWLVEDNPDDEALAIRALKKAGIQNEVVVDRDGERAVNRVSTWNFDNLPLLLLLDLKLPKLSGHEVLLQMRTHDLVSCIPIIVLTSSDETIDIKGCYAGGANAFVRKPVDFDEYQDTFNAIVHFWIKKNIPFRLT